jgi:hypothetical protein
LDWTELGDWIDRLCQVDGTQRLAGYREQAERVADAVGAPKEGIRKLSQMIGAALGTQKVHTASEALTARQASLPYDQERIRRFDRLVTALRESAPQNRPVHHPHDARYAYLPFFEVYFSNFIEGTEFELDEAIAVVYEGKKTPGRGDDSHDLIGTYRVVSDLDEMTTLAATADEFLQLLRVRHATILGVGRIGDLDSSRKSPIAAAELAYEAALERWWWLWSVEGELRRCGGPGKQTQEDPPRGEGQFPAG